VIVGEHDQSFGELSVYRSSLGDYAPLSVTKDAPTPIRIVKVLGSDNSPVPGVQLNVVDEDRKTVIGNGVTDKNGVVALYVKFSGIASASTTRRNYIRTTLLPTGYSTPLPRTVATDVSFYEVKYDPGKLDTLTKDTSSLKPDVTFRVNKTGTPEPRTELTQDQIFADPSLYTTGGAYGYAGKYPKGFLAFQIVLPNGKPAQPDPTIYYKINGNRADIDANGRIWASTSGPVTDTMSVVPYQVNPWIDSSKPEWGFSRVLTTMLPYPYVYEIKYAPEGGLMPAGPVTDEELGQTPVIPPKLAPGATMPPGSGSGAPAGAAKETHTLPFIFLTIAIIGGVFAYYRLKD
jgi:hypothetical protein